MVPVRSRVAACSAASLLAFAAIAGTADAVAPPAGGGPSNVGASQPVFGELSLERDGSRWTAVLPVVCLTGSAGHCAMSLTLTTARPIDGYASAARLGSARADVLPGRFGVLEIPLSPASVRRADRGRLAVRLTLTSSDAAGITVSAHRRTQLRFLRRQPVRPPEVDGLGAGA